MYLHGVHHARCRARMSVNRFPEPTSVGNGQIKITSQRVHCRQLAVAGRAVRATANCSDTRQNRPLLRALTKHLLPKTNEGQNRSLDIHRVALFVSGIGVRNSPVTTRSIRLAITTMNTRRIRFAPSATDVDLAQTLIDHFKAASRGGGTLSLQFDSGDERESFKLPESAVDLLFEVFDGVASGRRIEVVFRNTELTIQQAADVLNVSVPYLVGLLDSGAMPFREVGMHRRVRVDHALRYKRQAVAARRRVLDELVADAQELGMGY